MVDRIKASFELSLLVLVMFLFIIGVGFYAILEIGNLNEDSKQLYADRMLPMDQLGDVRYNASNILLIAKQVERNRVSIADALKIVKQSQDSIAINWAAYKLTYLVPEEKQFVIRTTPLINRSLQTIEKLKSVLARNDKATLKVLLDGELYTDLNPLRESMSRMIDLQVTIGKTLYEDNAKTYVSAIKKFWFSFVAVLAIAFPFLFYLIKKSNRIITDLNSREEELYQTEQDYRNLIDYAGEAILILDEATKIIDLNNYACKLFGYSREELLKMSIRELIPEEELDNMRESIAKVRKDKFALLYRKVRRKDGTEIDTEISNRLMEGKGFFAIIRDVTERKKTEQFIKESEEKYRNLFNNNPAFIIIWDPESQKVLEVNNEVLNQYGYTREEWMNMPLIKLRPPCEYDRFEAFAKNSLGKESSLPKEIWTHLNKNGTQMKVEAASHQITYNNQKAILSLGRNITEQVNAESELAEREAQLDMFIEHSPVSLAMFDKDMKYIATSERWLSDYNLSGQDIIGKSHYEVFPQIGQEWKDIHQRCLKGAIEKKEEDSFLNAAGSMEWQRWEIRPWYKASGEAGGIIIFTENITESKRATDLFKHQFENSPDIILYVNRQFKIEVLNRDSPTKTINELIGADCIAILPEESKQISREALNKCFETGENTEIESMLTHGRWVRSRFVPILTNGEVTHVMIFGTDITQRKRAEQNLIKSEEKYRALTENVSDGILLLDENLNIIFNSASAVRIAGYSVEETLHKNVLNFFIADEIERGKSYFDQALNSPNVSIQSQFRVLHRSGRVIWLEASILNMLEDKNVQGVIVNYRDITARKMHEEEQALMVSIVNSSDDAIISKTLDGIITSWNRGAEKLLGYTSAETIGRHISILIPTELRGEEVFILKDVRKGNSVDHYETKRMKKNGEIIEVSLTISPIKDSLGHVVGASKIMRDITAHKKNEEELVRYNLDLKKTNSELDRFVYSASHDLRAPLKSMLGLIGITMDGIEDEDDIDVDVVRERLAMLNKSVVKLDNFIEDILIYSKNARTELEKDAINFEGLIDEIKNNLEYGETANQIDFRLNMVSREMFVCDYKRLSIVLNNLISNAYKYSDVSKNNSFINVTFILNSGNAVISIEDNGIGIAAGDKQKVFDMFYRSTTISKGSGLGLYIVKEALEKLGGTIFVDSELGKGTKFTIEIPNATN